MSYTVPMDLHAPQTVGPYILHAPLRRGAVGVVYGAAHRVTGERVELEVASLGRGNDRLIRRIRLISRLHAPGVVWLVDQGVQRELVWWATASAVEAPALSWREVLVQAWAGLSALHQAGISHGGIAEHQVIATTDGGALRGVGPGGDARGDCAQLARLTLKHLSSELPRALGLWLEGAAQAGSPPPAAEVAHRLARWAQRPCRAVAVPWAPRRVDHALVDELWAHTEAGGAVWITGPLGAGRTELLRTLAVRGAREGRKVVTGVAEAGAKGPLSPFRRALKEVADRCVHEPSHGARLLGVGGGTLAALSPQVARAREPRPYREGLSTQDVHTRVASTLWAMWAAWAQEAPLVLLLDDLQWADRLSVEVLRQLAADPPPGVTLFLSHEQGWSVEAAGARVVLAPLSPAQAQAVAVDMGVSQPPPAGPVSALAWTLELHTGVAGVEAAWAHLLRGLSPGARALVEALAVLNREVSDASCGAVVGLSGRRLDAALGELWARGLVVGDAGLSLAHPTLRGPVLAQLRDQPALHRAVADALAVRGGDLAERAWHRAQSGEGERAARRYLEAGEQARRQHRARFAEALFRAGVALDPRDDQVGLGLSLGLGRQLVARAQWVEALPALWRAVVVAQRLGDLAAEGRARSDIGLALHGLRESSRGAGELLRATELLSDGPERALAWVRLAQLHRQGRRHLEALRCAAEAHTLAEGAEQVQLMALQCLGDVYFAEHRVEEAATAYGAGVEAARQLDNRTGLREILTNLALVQMLQSQAEGAATSLLEAVELARDLGDQQGLSHSLGFLGLVLQVLDRLSEAVSAMAEAIGIHEGTGDLQSEASQRVRLAEAYLRMARPGLAAGELGRARACYGELDDPLGYAELLTVEARWGRHQGRVAGTQAKLDQALALFSSATGATLEHCAHVERAWRLIEQGLPAHGAVQAALSAAARIGVTPDSGSIYGRELREVIEAASSR